MRTLTEYSAGFAVGRASRAGRWANGYHRRITALAALCWLAACGGGDASSTPTDPKVTPPVVPPVGTVPAVMTAIAGDGQSGEPGEALPIVPRVLVKDAAGLIVPGATVVFTVDSGGGALSVTSAVTASDGTASAGVWTLGSAEGRNTVKASTGAIPPVVFAASARIVPTTVVTQSIGTSGGTVTVSRVGSVMDGLRVTFPPGSFASAVDMQISYESSATLPTVAGFRVGTPLISLTTTGATSASDVFSIRIPVVVGDGEFPLVAIVNPATGFLDPLTTSTYDGTSVTATGWSLDETAHIENAPASALRAVWLPFALHSASNNVKLAVLLVKKTTLHNLIVDTSFRPGIDDWEFDPAVTPVYDGTTSSGAVVAERYYFRTKKSINNGSLWKRFQLAPGAVGSDAAGMRWTKQLSQDFDALVPRYAASAQAARSANPVQYDVNLLETLVASFIASKGAPQIVGFKNTNTGAVSTVLAYKWDGPSGLLYDANPALPGDATRKSTWNAQGFQCTQACVAIIGLNHLIQYQSRLDLEYPRVLDGTINSSVVPQAFVSSNGVLVGQTPSNGFDTLFVADDTARIWIECPTCAGQGATTLPLKHGATGIQTQKLYYEFSSNAWAPYTGAATADGFLINVKTFPIPNANAWANFRLGIEGRGYDTRPVTPGASGAWIGWKSYRVIKFAPTLSTKHIVPEVPATFTLGTAGGPALPADATYEFDWGDGIKTVLTSKPASVQHTYDSIGTYLVKLKVSHASGAGRIASLTYPVEVKHGLVEWRLESAVITTSGPALTGADGEDSTFYRSVVDAMNRIRNNPGDANILLFTDRDSASVLLQLLPPGTGGTIYGYVPTSSRAWVAAPPEMTIGHIGRGVIQGRYSILIEMSEPGLINTIDATMIPGFVSGTITIASWAFATAGPTYTLRFTAKFLEPF